MKKIKVGLLGLGRTGKIVAESLFKDRRFDFVFAVKRILVKPEDYDFNVETCEMLPSLIKKFKPEIIVDFTTPKATLHNIKKLKRGMGIVIATTGFKPNEIQNIKRHKDLKILYAPNISSGINVLMKVSQDIARLWPKSDVEILEEHFKAKRDAPSGTAKKIAKLFNKEIPIHSVRAGGITGIHRVIFAKENQKIIIEHESFSREVFAAGAKKAIIWLKQQKIGFYEMKEVYQ